MSPTYTTSTAFRQALETRLNAQSRREDVDIQRLRRQVAFDRLLCRLFHEPGRWTLKGGYAMELRVIASRTTRDIDLTMRLPAPGQGSLPERMLSLIQAAAAIDLKDFFTFLVGTPMKDLAGPIYGGSRFPVEARVDGRAFSRFHIDVSAGDPLLAPTEDIHGRDWLAFAGLAAGTFTAISREQQFAEKLHAYTLPRNGTVNSRVRDLIDMLLLIRMGMNNQHLLESVGAIFAQRHSHDVPEKILPPPENWAAPFAALAEECAIDPDISAAFREVAAYVKRAGVCAGGAA